MYVVSDEESVSDKDLPNILICGTPGVGKSMIARALEERTALKWFDVSKEAIALGYLDEYDTKLQCDVLRECEMVDYMENLMEKGGHIVDYHSADLFFEDWFDIVFVLRTDHTILYDRLQARGYNSIKLKENIECEIFQVILEEAKSYYNPEIVHELTNDTPEELINNVDKIYQWVQQWLKDRN